MPVILSVTLACVFVCVAVVSGFAASRMLSWATPERQRLRTFAPAYGGVLREDVQLAETPIPALRKLSKALPKSPQGMSRLRRRLAAAGHYELSAAIYYSAAGFALPLAGAGVALLTAGPSQRWILAAVAGVVGYLSRDFVLARMTRARANAIENGLPDALDLFVICIESGASLDQSVVKAGEELAMAHPVIADELRLLTTEIRAGKPRVEAFRNFASRTQVEDVRSLVTMLTQTDRFGTSVAQALRTHATTCRTKRRQRAEERAAKIGVKLVFPLVMCIFPALYLVCIGPAIVSIYNTFVAR
jgi:tight adherence protein C